MSGGLDSSVCAMLLLEAGHRVEGVTYRAFDAEPSADGAPDAASDARDLAARVGIPHRVVDLRERFHDIVVRRFASEYLRGRTPNPCVECNAGVKWAALLEIADQLGCQKLATGHYAAVDQDNGRFFLTCAADKAKDQTYFLWKLGQAQLARTLFPVGKFLKPQIRQIAMDRGHHRVGTKRESQEICFIPDDDYRRFLRQYAPSQVAAIGEGDIALADGTLVGRHQGYPFYTLGQRKGLGVALGEPRYVTAIDPVRNRVILGPPDDLLCDSIVISEVNMMKFSDVPDSGLEVDLKVRYRGPSVRALVRPFEAGLRAQLAQPVSAATPGQSAVMYQGDDVVGGGIIERAERCRI